MDKANNGDAFLAPGATVGILQQEPQLDETKTVRENVEEGVAIKAKLNRYNEVAELMATDYTDELMEEMGQLQEELDARRRVGPRLPARAGDGRAALPAARRAGHPPLRW